MHSLLQLRKKSQHMNQGNFNGIMIPKVDLYYNSSLGPILELHYNLQITDNPVINAHRFHPSPNKPMSVFTKILLYKQLILRLDQL